MQRDNFINLKMMKNISRIYLMEAALIASSFDEHETEKVDTLTNAFNRQLVLPRIRRFCSHLPVLVLINT